MGIHEQRFVAPELRAGKVGDLKIKWISNTRIACAFPRLSRRYTETEQLTLVLELLMGWLLSKF